MAERFNHANVTAGRRKTGKTTKMLKVIKAHKKKVLILDPGGNPMFSEYQQITPEMLPAWTGGVKRIVFSDVEESINYINEHVRNALVVLDDATVYIDWNLPRNVKKMVVNCKQKNVDLIFVFHSLGQIPPDLFRLVDSLTLLKTQDTASALNNFKNKIPNLEEVRKVFTEVNAHKDPFFSKTILLT